MTALTTDQVIAALAEALGKERALSDQESRWLEGALRRMDRSDGRAGMWYAGKPRWLAKDDAALKRHLRRNRTAREIARAMGKSEDSIRSRVRQLKRLGRLVAPKDCPMAAVTAAG